MAVYSCGWMHVVDVELQSLHCRRCTCLASSPRRYCHRGKQLLCAGQASSSLLVNIPRQVLACNTRISRFFHFRGLVDFFPRGPFPDHNSICRVPNLWLSHRRLCGSAKTSAEHFNYRQNDRMETLFFAGLSQNCPELMSWCNPAFRKESGVSSD